MQRQRPVENVSSLSDKEPGLDAQDGATISVYEKLIDPAESKSPWIEVSDCNGWMNREMI